ncbi:hypothetical protein J6590_096540 [Homalodisca vitripennis]|nr:hypothetical protein J6590_096540 [Homalodisca vitripennis]
MAVVCVRVVVGGGWVDGQVSADSAGPSPHSYRVDYDGLLARLDQVHALRDDENLGDKGELVPRADGAAALNLALRYLEQQATATPADIMFMTRWRNYASSNRLSSMRQKTITEFMSFNN